MKEKILQALANQIDIHGIRKFTLDSIAKDIKISKKTIYKYYNSKEELIEEYFHEIIESDKESVEKIINSNFSLEKKLYNVIHSYHKYKLPSSVLNDVKIFYPNEWKKILEFKNFKVEVIKQLLLVSKEKGEIKKDINLEILCLIIEKVSEEILDNEIIDKAISVNCKMEEMLKIIMNGILDRQ
ncbi:transcriptional regulator, TetR family [Clostridium cavendishii DSM 21758]|uniref:Transcriptional regulator, TetR family n=1 Tax=Clostridium cavendishii DSM 21758 TaxID=1121302 RepID=A0A1M6L0B3_9CLOT|nr:TetR/AcrR family transcriptional regulator [Clostridium cavendishii]SHJ64627.1 transcriptional regulator, TetR family [Clostridium cavendishii DSM 21758]